MVRGEAEVGNSFLGKSPVKMTQARVRRTVPLWAQIRDSAVTAAQQFHGSKFLCTFLCSLAFLLLLLCNIAAGLLTFLKKFL